MTNPLSWTHDVSEFGERSRSFERSATEAERAAVAEALGLLGCTRLEARYDLKPLPRGGFRMSGTLEAHVTQACVVTLEPVEADLEEEIAQEFQPPEHAAGAEQTDSEHAVLEGVDVAEIAHGEIDAGRIVFETLSGALDPYPRKAGVEFDWSDPKALQGEVSPFAALGRLKKGQE